MSKLASQQPALNPAPIFAALGDATRLHLLVRLSDGRQHSIGQLSTGLELSRQGVTKHLQVMEEVGLVVSTRIGRENRFHYVPESMAPVQTYLQQVSQQWDEAIERLKTLVEAE